MIGFAGLSHLGLNSALATAAKGFDVIAYGEDGPLCDRLNRGEFPFLEPGLDELWRLHRSRVKFTPDAAELSRCQLIYFSLDVPTDDNGGSDLAGLSALIERVLAVAARETVLVVLSQVPPGFTRKLAGQIESNNQGWQLFYQVETLIFGRAVERALHPERFIVGSSQPRAPLPNVYAKLLSGFDCPVLRMRYESAELAKISINMCLVSAVSVANTMAELCEQVGADWSEIVPALKLDKRIGQFAYLAPGLGIAGGNLERDMATVVSLANEFGTDDGVPDAWISNSRYRRDWALRILQSEVISRASEPAIAIWGLAYKQDTNSTKNSPALFLLDSLKPFQVRAYDPVVNLAYAGRPSFVQSAGPLEACSRVDALVVMTPWPEFSSISIAEIAKAMRGRVIIDPYSMLDGDLCARAGFSYFRLGSPPVKGVIDSD